MSIQIALVLVQKGFIPGRSVCGAGVSYNGLELCRIAAYIGDVRRP